MIEVNEKKLIINHIIEKEFTPELVRDVIDFTEEVAKKRAYRAEYRKDFGYDIVLEPTKLNLTPTLQKLQDKLYEALK